MFSKILIIGLTLLSVATLPGAVAKASVWTDTWDEMSVVGTEIGYDTGARKGTLQIFIARIIKQLLTFLGIVFLVIVFYGGVLWMTAGGNEEQVGKAQKVLSRGGIGLAIIVLSWAISVFAMNALLTGAGLDDYNP